MRLLCIVILMLASVVRADPIPGATEMLNGFRAGQGRAALQMSAKLQQMAQNHADDMARQNYFSHRGKDGSGLRQRARRVGYKHCKLAENIAMGQTSVDEVMNAWAGSTGHRRNMLLRRVKEFGLARAPGDIWVMVLGRSC
ncbi:CAP domain-containing protein [Thalassococcus sp. BH17M4-6]|uniref:CAP domain-containing protein n=1 Tax=Thalassococcus sp. BH17M4-6 TaxID=3413148 RepID=UPI003BD647FF